MKIKYSKRLIKKKVLSVLTKYVSNNYSNVSTKRLLDKNLKFDLNFDILDLTEITIDIETELDCSIDTECYPVDEYKFLNQTVGEFINFLYNHLNGEFSDTHYNH